MKFSEIRSLLFYTAPKQLSQYAWFRLKLFFIRRNLFPFLPLKKQEVCWLDWKETKSNKIYIRGNEFTFLNLSTVFEEKVEWGYGQNGKLWAYQLESFEFLHQKSSNNETGIKLINEFICYLNEHPNAFTPYTASLRIINWIKFFSEHKIENRFFINSLYEQSRKLYHSIEWHLQNNHLLENGFALLFAGLFLNEGAFFSCGKRIIITELRKQILPDGGHFERSPMYHQLMLQRVLDVINLLQKNKATEKEVIQELKDISSGMLGWMNSMKFDNGMMPMVNDSAEGISLTCDELNQYARELKIQEKKITLNESGFRKVKTSVYECLIDVGGLEQVNAGHGHAASLSFILHVHKQPFIIDTGISTYEAGERRTFERSTEAHNTVTFKNRAQSELWDSFRVGKRVKILGINEGKNFLEGSIRFFQGAIVHTRRFEFFDNSLIVSDSISGEILEPPVSFLHVDKNSEIAHVKSKVNSNIADIKFEGYQNIKIDKGFTSTEFNRLVNCYRISISFSTNLTTTFTFLPNLTTGA